MSVLKTYEEQAKKFGITDAHNVPVVARLAFAREQQQQMQAMVNRLLFDLSTTEIHKLSAKDETTKAAYSQKGDQYANDLRQTKSALDIAIELVKELEDSIE